VATLCHRTPFDTDIAAASIPALALELRADDGDRLALNVVLDRAAATQPVSLSDLRANGHIRTTSLCQTLNELLRDGRVRKGSQRLNPFPSPAVVATVSRFPFPARP